jgi:hypothetical protein
MQHFAHRRYPLPTGEETGKYVQAYYCMGYSFPIPVLLKYNKRGRERSVYLKVYIGRRPHYRDVENVIRFDRLVLSAIFLSFATQPVMGEEDSRMTRTVILEVAV